MSKIDLNTSIADYGFSQINANFQKIEDELNQKVLYRDNPVGEPNTIENTVDANNQDIINVKDLYVDNELFISGNTLQEAIDAAAGGVGADAAASAAASAASASSAANSATSASSSATNAANSYDSFDDRYLGAKSVAPTTDNDGNPLLLGALYWDTVIAPGGTFPATSITYTPTGDIGSTTVQAALSELDSEKARLNGNTAVAFSTSTLNASGLITPASSIGIKGTATNDNAPAGSIGEFIATTGVSAALTTGVTANVVSLSLTAGDWEVWGVVSAGAVGVTTTSLIVATNSTSATLPSSTLSSKIAGYSATSNNVSQPAPTQRYSLASTTTVYLVTQVAFSGGALAVDGSIFARRVR